MSPFLSSTDRSRSHRPLACLARSLSVFRVSLPPDVFLLTTPCRFISPDRHSWGSPSKAFPFHTAGLPSSFPCPLVVTSQAVSNLVSRLQGLAPCESPLAIRGVSTDLDSPDALMGFSSSGLSLFSPWLCFHKASSRLTAPPLSKTVSLLLLRLSFLPGAPTVVAKHRCFSQA